MLKKENRLPPNLKPLSLSVDTPYFVLKVGKNNNGFKRFGFVVSKKIDTRATVRNEIKRKLRSCIEQLVEKIEPGNDLAFIFKKEILMLKREEICKNVQDLLKRQQLLK